MAGVRVLSLGYLLHQTVKKVRMITMIIVAKYPKQPATYSAVSKIHVQFT